MKNEVAKIYETVMSIPGMSDDVRVQVKTSRKNMLLLNKIIEKGLYGNESTDPSVKLLDNISADAVKEITSIAVDLLDKAGLTEMNEKLKAF